MTTLPLSRRVRSVLFIALRAVFRAVPMSEARRDAIRSRFLRGFPTVRPLPAQGQLASAYEQRPRVRADERCIGYVEYSEEPLPDPLPATLVAFYLPQFHTIPENDGWWGKGFTEWRNVTRALPQFEGHLQPRLPGDLGFYDLRNPQVMRDQAKLAKTYGLSAFCFYFYWFGGKTLLEEPLRNWLADKSIDFRYCLCWANENWTRRWDGRDDEILIAQKHSAEDDIAFIEYVAEYLRDPRYLRVDGKPMLLLYRPMLLPDAKATAERWRVWCRDNGIGEIHLAYVQSFEKPPADSLGFDAAVQFPPNAAPAADITGSRRLLNPDYQGTVLDWRTMATSYARVEHAPGVLYPAVNCGWDNEPRRPGLGRTWALASPFEYRRWLRQVVQRPASKDSPAVFINAWNEWSEGAVLEPDRHAGYGWLHATRSALRLPQDDRPHALIHAWYPELLPELLDALGAASVPWRLTITTGPSGTPAVERILARYGGSHLGYEILEQPNRGRDILPFLKAASRLLHDDQQIVLKLHTKRSPHRRDGDNWRRQMVSALVGRDHGSQHLAQMRTAHGMGLLVPRHHLQPMSYFFGANRDNVHRLAERLLVPEIESQTFASGSMYWIRLDAIAPLLSLPLTESDFEEESGQLDGTMAHAIERLIAPLARSGGYAVEEIGTPDGAPPGYQAPSAT